MIVEQIDAFKSWLTAVLKPMCEADPAALAKYVLALIKKDKSVEELRKSMVEQLDVFLESETETFVNLVFQTISNKEYINTPVIPNANPPNPNIPSTATLTSSSTSSLTGGTKENKIIVSPSELPSLSENLNGSSTALGSTTITSSSNLSSTRAKEGERGRSDRREDFRNDKDEKGRRRSRHRSLSRNRSRSRSWDRSKRSRSRERADREKSRDRDRDAHPRDKRGSDRSRTTSWRNKSPPATSSSSSRRYDRRRSRTPTSPPSRLRSRSRTPPHLRHSHRSKYRSRLSASRSRSRSPQQRKDSNSSRPGTPTQDSNHGDLDLRLTNTTQSIQNVVSAATQANSASKRRCRDFDEKGYCMRGEMCPYDHGVDPVVLEDEALSRVLNYNPNGSAVVGVGSNVVVGQPTTMLGGAGVAMGPRATNEYNPQAPQLWSGGGRGGFNRGPRPLGGPRLPIVGGPLNQFNSGPPPPPNLQQRELIPIPVVMDNNQHPQQQQSHPHHLQQNYYHDHENMYGGKKKGFDYNRLGPRSKTHNTLNQNCALEVRKIPPALNIITHLNNHFGKFGKIVNIQVQFEGDPEAALITFSSHAEANAAYRSTEAVLNNRFIKMFWHNNNNSTNNEQQQVQPRADEGVTTVAAAVTSEKDAEMKSAQVAAIKKSQELLAAKEKLKKNQDSQRKEVLKIKNDLQKRKQELLEKQLSQQKILIEKMEKLPPGPQRDTIKETIKKTQESIEAIKRDLEQSAKAAKSAQLTAPVSIAALKRTKEETEREILDVELELMAKQQEGADTKEIQKRLLELKTKVASLTAAIAAGALGRGRGALAGRRFATARHLLKKNNFLDNKLNKSALTYQKHTVDHRPTRLLVSGYETDEQDAVLTHFQQFGEIVDYQIDSTLPSITLNYKTRKEAEMALLKGKHFQDRTLSITWSTVSNASTPTVHRSNSTTSTGDGSINNANNNANNNETSVENEDEHHLIDSSLLEGTEEDHLGPEISEEVLLQDDEEEDDENEERSWRHR